MVVMVKSYFAHFLRVWGPISQKKRLKDQIITYSKIQGPPEIVTLKEKKKKCFFGGPLITGVVHFVKCHYSHFIWNVISSILIIQLIYLPF